MKIGKEEIIAYVKIPIEDKYIIYPIVKFNPEMDSMELIIFYTARIEIKLFEKEGKEVEINKVEENIFYQLVNDSYEKSNYSLSYNYDHNEIYFFSNQDEIIYRLNK